MTDPRRLLESEVDEFTGKLLRSISEDEPGDGSIRKTAAALGIGTALLGGAGVTTASAAVGASGSAASAAGTSSALGSFSLLKWLGIGAIGGALAVGGAEVVNSGSTSPKSPPPSASATAAENPAPTLARPHPELPVEVTIPQSNDTTLPDRAKKPRIPAPEANRIEEARPSLTADVAKLDRARKALKAQDPKAALDALNEYEGSTTTGVLNPEATVLRIEALVKRGDHDAAKRMAERFVATNPNSPHAPRLRALVTEDASKKSE